MKTYQILALFALQAVVIGALAFGYFHTRADLDTLRRSDSTASLQRQIDLNAKSVLNVDAKANVAQAAIDNLKTWQPKVVQAFKSINQCGYAVETCPAKPSTVPGTPALDAYVAQLGASSNLNPPPYGSSGPSLKCTQMLPGGVCTTWTMVP